MKKEKQTKNVEMLYYIQRMYAKHIFEIERTSFLTMTNTKFLIKNKFFLLNVELANCQ